MKKRIYLDNASITPIDPRVLKLVQNIQTNFFYNPSSLYEEGRKTRKIIDEARSAVANVLQSKPNEIFFTSGGTESNNLAIQGVFNYHNDRKNQKRKSENSKLHFITSTIEHSSVLEIFRHLENKGVDVTYISPNQEGIITVEFVLKSLKKETVFISLMYGNNEIGTINPISRIFKEVKKIQQVICHTDASQGACYLNMRADHLGADLITLDGSKIYGPRGTGVLFKKRAIKLSTVIFGGGHEEGIRSGTENTAGIAGFGEALKIAEEEKDKENQRLTKLRDEAFDFLIKNIPLAMINGSEKNRLPNNINFCVPGIDSEFMVIKLDLLGISCSSVTTCRNIGDDSSSYVIEEIYKNEKDHKKRTCSKSSLRVSLGRFTKKDELTKALSIIIKEINKKLDYKL